MAQERTHAQMHSQPFIDQLEHQTFTFFNALNLCSCSDFGRLYLTIYWAKLCDFGLVGKPWMCSFQEELVCPIWTIRLKVMAQKMNTAQTSLRLDIGPLRSLVAQPNEIQFKHGWTN